MFRSDTRNIQPFEVEDSDDAWWHLLAPHSDTELASFEFRIGDKSDALRNCKEQHCTAYLKVHGALRAGYIANLVPLNPSIKKSTTANPSKFN